MRHEHKFIINEYQRAIIQSRIESVMERDNHVQNGTYLITSLYFDDFQNGCYLDNEFGVDRREKFRIRYYNNNVDFMRLELKSKLRGMCDKKQCKISREQTDAYIRGVGLCISDDMPQLMRKLQTEFDTKCLHPDIIVDYERIPYIYQTGNVRITFDCNICASTDINNFLSATYHKVPILPDGMLVLEIKYDDILPGFIEDIVQFGGLGKETFSKFYLCKRQMVL